MSQQLTAGQRALLKTQLLLREHELNQRLNEHTGGLTRAEHAHEVLQQDADDAPQRDQERVVDLTRIDIEIRELGAVSEALRRLPSDAFGQCLDCGGGIPFDRLKLEPWALRCVPCESAHEV